MKIKKMKLENKLYKVMCDKGVTRYWLKKETKYEWNHINGICKGDWRASEVCAIRIAKALNCKVEDIFTPESRD